MKRIGLVSAIPVIVGVGYFLADPELRASAPDTSTLPSASLSAANSDAAPAGKKRKGSAIPLVVVAEAKAQDVPVTKTVVGTIEPVDTVAIRPQIDGVVIADSVTDGQMVKAGDVLFRLDDRAIRAMIDKDQAQLAKDEASLVAANLDLSGAQDLEKRHVDTTQQVYQAEAAVKARLGLHPRNLVPARGRVEREQRVQLFAQLAIAVMTDVRRLATFEEIPAAMRSTFTPFRSGSISSGATPGKNCGPRVSR